MKLELKHLAAYLPYNLSISDEYGNISILNCIDIEEIDGIELKPILRPLSDLTKEIEVNVEKFVPLEKLISLAIDEYDDGEQCFLSENITEFDVINNNSIAAYFIDDLKFTFTYSNNRKLFSLYTPQRITHYFGMKYMDKLLEWHFDIFELIENNLAIDINALK